MTFHHLPNKLRLAAALLALPLALSTTGCSSTGRMALSLGLHACTESSADQGTPQPTTHYAAMPQYEAHPHRHSAPILLVETAHHQQRNEFRTETVTEMKTGTATDSFTPVAGESTSN